MLPPPLSLQILGIIHLWQRPPVATGTPPHCFLPCRALQATGAHTSVTMAKFLFSSSKYLPIFCRPHSSGLFPGGSSLCLAQGQAWHPWLPRSGQGKRLIVILCRPEQNPNKPLLLPRLNDTSYWELLMYLDDAEEFIISQFQRSEA